MVLKGGGGALKLIHTSILKASLIVYRGSNGIVTNLIANILDHDQTVKTCRLIMV